MRGIAGVVTHNVTSTRPVLSLPTAGIRPVLGRGRLYDGCLQRLVHVLKYERRATLAEPLGRQHGDDVLHDVDFVVPVPLHRQRRRTRSFNQEATLAAHLAPPMVQALRRTKATRPQTERSATRHHATCETLSPAR